MNTLRLLQSMQAIDDDILERSEPKRRTRRGRLRWVPAAACACLILTAVLWAPAGERLGGNERIPAVTPGVADDRTLPQPSESAVPAETTGPDMQGAPLAPQYEALTLAEARNDPDFGAFLPAETPVGFNDEAFCRYEDPAALTALWTRGYDELRWHITLLAPADKARIAAPAEKEKYDLSLYPIPRAESVPDGLRQVVDDPIFLLEELTAEMVWARAYLTGESGDSAGYRMHFSVLLGDMLIKVSAKGLSPDWVYGQLAALRE